MAIIASTRDLTDAQDLARAEARLRDDTAIALLVNNAGAAAGRLRVNGHNLYDERHLKFRR